MPALHAARYYSGPPSPLGRLTQACRHRSKGLGPFRRFGQWALVLVTRGLGTYEDERGIKGPLHPGDVILVFPDVPQRYGPPPGEPPWEEMYLVFEGPVFETWRRVGLLTPDRPIFPGGNPVALSRVFSTFLEKPTRSGPDPILSEVVRIQELLAGLLAPSSHASMVNAVEKVKQMLQVDPTHPVTGEGFARSLGMGYESFRKIFREATGVPPAQYRLQRMVEEACRLMTGEGLSNAEVAHRLGWSDGFHFSRCFKKHMGQTPRQYRERRLSHPP